MPSRTALRSALIIGVLLIVPALGCTNTPHRGQSAAEASVDQAPAPDPSALVGTWMVDLRPTPDADPYLVKLVIESAEGSSFEGTFYNGSPISDARISTTFGVLRFAFVTNDGSGPYHTAGELHNNTITGTTHSLDRGFLMPWRGERVD